MSESESSESWTEADSEIYHRLTDVAVPSRETQIATLLTLLPIDRVAPSRLVEIGCGPGALSHAILDAFPASTVTALDGSKSMLEHAADRLAPFGERLRLEAFDLAGTDWHHHLDGVDGVVSSLVIHHLDGRGKKALFAAVAHSLADGGGFFIADLVEPQRAEPRELFASSWDASAEQRAGERGNASLYTLFRDERWNIYTHPDPADKPSPLFDQLRWLAEAGFDVVDCFWMSCGHAVYGGYRDRERRFEPLAYSDALASARRAISSASR